jgi:hypothetical protein
MLTISNIIYEINNLCFFSVVELNFIAKLSKKRFRSIL